MSDTQDNQMTEDTQASAPAKPRRTRARKKTEGAEAPAEGMSAEAGAAPAKKTTRRRTTKKSAEGESAADGAAEAPKPRRTRARKAVAAEAGEGAAPAASDAAQPASAAPAPAAEGAAPERPRRTRVRKKVEDAPVPAAEAASAEASAEQPAAPAASAAPAAPAVEAVSPAPAADEAAAPAKKTAERTTSVVRKRSSRSEAAEGEGRSEHAALADRSERAERPERPERPERRERAGQNGQGKGTERGQGKKNGHDRSDRNNDRNNRRQRHESRPREPQPSVTKEELAELKVVELRARAAELGVDGTGVKKAELVDVVYDAICKAEGFTEVTGVLDIMNDGYGFLRTCGYLPGESDIYVGLATIRRNNLRKGDMVTGITRPARPNDKFAALQKVTAINGVAPEELGFRPKFADLTPIFPDERLWMEHGKNTSTARVIDLTAPIGKGQRGLIVSPPKAGKTTVLKDIAASITANNPEVHLMYLGIDERPEEATDMERSIRGEVVSSTFDMPSENHIQVAELVIERAKRLVEMGRDVVILLDSITRLARAYNLAQPASGRILSGGVDSTALYPPKRFLGAARNIEHGGSLTILASALIETGSKMDEVIFEEFKGTGNMELKLDRNLADRRIFPAIDPITSGTRKEELLLEPQEAPLIWAVRRILANTNSTERAMDMLIKSLKQTNSNQEFLLRTAKKAQSQHGGSENFEL